MSATVESMPIVWPSLTDLATLLGVGLSTLSRLPAVRRLPKTRIGREVKVPPAAAVAILVARGLSQDLAAARIQRVIELRRAHVPAFGPVPPSSPLPAPQPSSRLVPSRGVSAHETRLTPFRIPHDGPSSPRLDAPDMERFTRRDRALGNRAIPIEEYVYGNR